MSYGLEVFDSNRVKTLGMEDFTITRLATMTIPKNPSGPGARPAPRTDYILMDVLGYDPATCFVLITPKAYSTGGEPRPYGWGYIPTYKDLGGTQIAIYTYANYRDPTGIGNDYITRWVENSVECTVEVVRVN